MAAIAGVALVHRCWLQQRQLAAARRRGLYLEVCGAASDPAAATGPTLIDLDDLDRSTPHRFYLPDASYEQLSDCYAVVERVRLPLHGQVLAARAAVLRQAMFVAKAAGGESATELSAAFSGYKVRPVAVFLRFMYSPDHATPGSLREVHRAGGGLLAAVAGLAHRLDAATLLSQIEAYLQAASANASIHELIATVQLAESCHLAALCDTCLELLARQLAAAGPFWHEHVRPNQLAVCTSDSLAALACKMAGQVRAGAFTPPAVHGIMRGPGGQAGGFTWVLQHFSKLQGRVTSPWVEVGGVEWRLKVWPKGDDAAGGSHLSAYLECNFANAQSSGHTAVEAFYDFSFLDQSEDGLHFVVDCGKDVFTATTQNWGKTRMMPLEELRRADRSYLDQDRLAVRISIRVLPAGVGASVAAVAPLAAAPAPAQLAPLPAAGPL